MKQNSIPHLAPDTGSAKIQENFPALFQTSDLRVQLYTWNKALMINNLQDTSKLYGLVSIESCKFLAR